MIQILTYIDSPVSKVKGYTRPIDKPSMRNGRISAEEELDLLIKEGWEIISMSTSDSITGAFTAGTSMTKLVVILRHDD